MPKQRLQLHLFDKDDVFTTDLTSPAAADVLNDVRNACGPQLLRHSPHTQLMHSASMRPAPEARCSLVPAKGFLAVQGSIGFNNTVWDERSQKTQSDGQHKSLLQLDTPRALVAATEGASATTPLDRLLTYSLCSTLALLAAPGPLA
jgi:hypothetical protein